MATSHEVFDLLQYAGNQMDRRVEYWDALFDNQSLSLISKDNVDERIVLPEFSGIQLRSFKDGVWRSTSTFILKKTKLKELAKRLIKPRHKTRRKIKLTKLKPLKLNVTLPVKKSPADVSLKSKIEDFQRSSNR